MFGFTRQEQHIVLFLIFSLLVGVGIKLIRSNNLPTVSANATVGSEFSLVSEQLNTITPEPVASDYTQETFLEKKPSRAKEEQSGSLKVEESVVKESAAVVVNINIATEDELQQVPRIGPVLARRIVQYRNEHGLFTDVDELSGVKGIGAKTLKSIKSYLTVK